MALFSDSKMLDMGTKIIAVRVGPEPKHTDFTIHEKLIRASSEFFQNALSREWRESQERVVRLPTCDEVSFRIYTQWLYTGRLHVTSTGSGRVDAESSSLVYGYLLGDYLQDCSYKDSIIDALFEWQKGADTEKLTRFLRSWAKILELQLPGYNPLRRLLVDMMVYKGSHDWWVNVVATLPAQLVQDVAVGLSQRCKVSTKVSPLIGSISCAYHSHEYKPCYIPKEAKETATASPSRIRQSNYARRHDDITIVPRTRIRLATTPPNQTNRNAQNP